MATLQSEEVIPIDSSEMFIAGRQVLDTSHYFVATAVILWFLIGFSIRGVLQVSQELGDIASGDADLTQQIEAQSRDEVGLFSDPV